jgi:hypothetical protein
VIPGTTILDGIHELARGGVTYSQDASAPVPARATGIVVVGETPYAEGFGDVGGPRWGFDPGDNGVLRPPQTMQLSAQHQLRSPASMSSGSPARGSSGPARSRARSATRPWRSPGRPRRATSCSARTAGTSPPPARSSRSSRRHDPPAWS